MVEPVHSNTWLPVVCSYTEREQIQFQKGRLLLLCFSINHLNDRAEYVLKSAGHPALWRPGWESDILPTDWGKG